MQKAVRIEPSFASSARSLPSGRHRDAPAKNLNPKFIGGFLLHQWLLSEDSKFGITSADIDKAAERLPDQVRQHFSVWAHLYLAWLMRGMAGNKYGQEFQIEMMAHAFARLENSGIPDVHVPVDAMRTFLGHMDEALRAYIEAQDKKDPVAEFATVQMMAATRLLLYTDGGLFKDDKQAFGDAMFALGDALVEIENKARPFLVAAVERTAESQEAF